LTENVSKAFGDWAQSPGRRGGGVYSSPQTSYLYKGPHHGREGQGRDKRGKQERSSHHHFLDAPLMIAMQWV